MAIKENMARPTNPTPAERIASASRRPAADPIVTPSSTICDTPESIERFRMITCLSGLTLEAKGIRVHRGVSCLVVARRDYGIKARTADDAYARLRTLMIAKGIIDEQP